MFILQENLSGEPVSSTATLLYVLLILFPLSFFFAYSLPSVFHLYRLSLLSFSTLPAKSIGLFFSGRIYVSGRFPHS